MSGAFDWFTNGFKGGSDTQKEADSFLEPVTGLTFKGEFCSRSNQSACPSFAGRGARLKNVAGIKVKVYAAGVFVDETAAKKKFRANSHLPAIETFALSNDIEKTIQLIFARGVKGASVLAALDERLKPKLEGTPELTAFRELFDGLKVEKGNQISFTADYGVLTTRANNKSLGAINSKVLCDALFDIYLGKEPVINELKQEVGASLSKLALTVH